jgi:hypothetical protein
MRKTVILFLVGTIIVIGFSSGCTQNDQKNNQPTSTDVAFLNWTTTNLATASTILGTVQSFINAGNESIQAAALYADEHKIFIDNLSDQLTTFQVSSSYQSLKGEFDAFLQDFQQAIIYLDEGTEAINQAMSSLTSSKNHADECFRIIDSLEG